MNWLHLLTVIFVIAKIFNYLAWSWWLVFLPSIVSLTIALVFWVGFIVLAIVVNK